MRIIGATLVAVALIAAFVAGRVSGPHPSQIAAAQGNVAVIPGQSLMHFKCYQTQLKLDKPAAVLLRDQFGEEKMELTYADLFCTPVLKRLLNGKPIPVPGPADHLTCYRGEDRSVNETRLIVNQLQRAEISITVPRYLCVPTWKSRTRPQPTPTNFPPRTPTPTPRGNPNPLTAATPGRVVTMQPKPTPTR